MKCMWTEDGTRVNAFDLNVNWGMGKQTLRWCCFYPFASPQLHMPRIRAHPYHEGYDRHSQCTCQRREWVKGLFVRILHLVKLSVPNVFFFHIPFSRNQYIALIFFFYVQNLISPTRA